MNHAHYAAPLCCGHQWPQFGGIPHGVAHREASRHLGGYLCRFGISRLWHNQARQCKARLAGIQKTGIHCGTHCRFKIGIIQYHRSRLAAQFQCHTFHAFSCQRANACPGAGRPRHGNQMDIGVRHQRFASGRAVACDQIKNTRRQTRLLNNFSEHKRRQRRDFRWLPNHGAPRGKSGPKLRGNLE